MANGSGTKISGQFRQWGTTYPTQYLVLCEDGALRRTSYLAAQPDTWFSIRASIRVKGKTVPGYVTTSEDDDRSVIYHFVAYEPKPSGFSTLIYRRSAS